MNVIDAVVKKVLSEPKLKIYDTMKWWEVEVLCIDMGGEQIKRLQFESEKEAKHIKEGYVFQH